MTHVVSTDITSDQFEKDQYVVFLTRDMDFGIDDEHPAPQLEGVWGPLSAKFDPDLITRLATFAKHFTLDLPSNTMWGDIYPTHAPLLEVLDSGDLEEAHNHLQVMHSSPLMDGISQGYDQARRLVNNPKAIELRLLRIWDTLLSVSEYTGVLGIQNQEQGPTPLRISIETLVNALPENIVAPPWQANLLCLKTPRGLFSERDLISLYIALQISLKIPVGSRILEIGGGAGYTAYWLYLMGYQNIYMLDIPTVSIAQAYQLAANIGAENISFSHENKQSAVTFITADDLKTLGKVDVVLNCDSMPEMTLEWAHTYLDFISKNSRYFYSINQETATKYIKPQVDINSGIGRGDPSIPEEHRQHVVWKLIHKNYPNLYRMERYKFWMRDGYTEEWYGNIPQNGENSS